MTLKSQSAEASTSASAATTTTITTTAVKAGLEEVLKKIVVRRLPPTLTKEQFLDQVSPMPPYDYFSYCKADMSLGANAFCRAYISFLSADDVFIFKEKFDNYVFVDAKSIEYPAIVEFAPFQRKLRNINTGAKSEKKTDNKCNSIELDPDYLKFVENMDKPGGEQLPSCEVILEQIEQREKELSSGAGSKMTTPLLEFLKKKREDRRSAREKEREMKRKKDDDRKRRKDDDKRSKGKESEHQQFKILAKPQSASADQKQKQSSASAQNHNQSQRYGSGSNHSKSYGDKDSKNSSGGRASSNKASAPSTLSSASLADSSKSSFSERKREKDTLASSSTSIASQQSSATTPTSEQPLAQSASTSSAAAAAEKKDSKSKRPSMEIYNPAARAALRRQQPKPS